MGLFVHGLYSPITICRKWDRIEYSHFRWHALLSGGEWDARVSLHLSNCDGEDVNLGHWNCGTLQYARAFVCYASSLTYQWRFILNVNDLRYTQGHQFELYNNNNNVIINCHRLVWHHAIRGGLWSLDQIDRPRCHEIDHHHHCRPIQFILCLRSNFTHIRHNIL